VALRELQRRAEEDLSRKVVKKNVIAAREIFITKDGFKREL
jgi:hypothetical protein